MDDRVVCRERARHTSDDPDHPRNGEPHVAAQQCRRGEARQPRRADRAPGDVGARQPGHQTEGEEAEGAGADARPEERQGGGHQHGCTDGEEEAPCVWRHGEPGQLDPLGGDRERDVADEPRQ